MGKIIDNGSNRSKIIDNRDGTVTIDIEFFFDMVEALLDNNISLCKCAECMDNDTESVEFFEKD